MKNKKLYISLLMTLSMGLVQGQSLVVEDLTASKETYDVSEINKITFSAREMILNGTNTSKEFFNLADLRFLSFTPTEPAHLIEPQYDTKGLIVYPNPTYNYVTISFLSKDYPDKFDIITLSGKVIQTVKASSTNATAINIADFPSGVYLIRYASKREIHTYKIIKK